MAHRTVVAIVYIIVQTSCLLDTVLRDKSANSLSPSPTSPAKADVVTRWKSPKLGAFQAICDLRVSLGRFGRTSGFALLLISRSRTLLVLGESMAGHAAYNQSFVLFALYVACACNVETCRTCQGGCFAWVPIVLKTPCSRKEGSSILGIRCQETCT